MRSGRGHGWVKVKCNGREEFVVLGWTPPGGSRKGIGALHVGYYDREGRLHYAGGAGSGYAEKELTTLRTRLDRLKAETPLDGVRGAMERKCYVRSGSSVSAPTDAGSRSGRSSPRATVSGRMKA